MDPKKFQAELSKIAPDLRILFDPKWTERYWIVQQRARYTGIIMPGNRNPIAFFRLYPIENEDGSFRYPDQSDLVKCMDAVISGKKLWANGEAYMREVKEAERATDEKMAADRRGIIREVGKDIFNMNKRRHFT